MTNQNELEWENKPSHTTVPLMGAVWKFVSIWFVKYVDDDVSIVVEQNHCCW